MLGLIAYGFYRDAARRAREAAHSLDRTTATFLTTNPPPSCSYPGPLRFKRPMESAGLNINRSTKGLPVL